MIHVHYICAFRIVAPWFDKPKQDLEFDKFKGDNVSFECAAQGYPQVEWKVQKQGDDTVKSCISKCFLITGWVRLCKM